MTGLRKTPISTGKARTLAPGRPWFIHHARSLEHAAPRPAAPAAKAGRAGVCAAGAGDRGPALRAAEDHEPGIADPGRRRFGHGAAPAGRTDRASQARRYFGPAQGGAGPLQDGRLAGRRRMRAVGPTYRRKVRRDLAYPRHRPRQGRRHRHRPHLLRNRPAPDARRRGHRQRPRPPGAAHGPGRDGREILPLFPGALSGPRRGGQQPGHHPARSQPLRGSDRPAEGDDPGQPDRSATVECARHRGQCAGRHGDGDHLLCRGAEIRPRQCPRHVQLRQRHRRGRRHARGPDVAAEGRCRCSPTP